MTIGILIALGVGLAIASQVAILGRASRTIHPLAISLALQLAGVAVGLGWVAWTRTWPQVTEVVRSWWWLPLGIAGWLVVAALGISAARLGAGATLALVVTSQVVTGIGLDALAGRLEVGTTQLAGVVLLIAGAVLVSWR